MYTHQANSSSSLQAQAALPPGKTEKEVHGALGPGPPGPSSGQLTLNSTRCRRWRGSVLPRSFLLQLHTCHTVVYVWWCTQTQVPETNLEPPASCNNPTQQQVPLNAINKKGQTSAFLLSLFRLFHFPTKCNLQKHQNHAEFEQSKKLEFFSPKVHLKHRSVGRKRQTPPG